MTERHCPDCEVPMKEVGVTAEGVGDLYVGTERDGGVLDRLGVPDHSVLDPVLCPDCGLIRLYADIEEDAIS
jgi:hypothetical protein